MDEELLKKVTALREALFTRDSKRIFSKVEAISLEDIEHLSLMSLVGLYAVLLRFDSIERPNVREVIRPRELKVLKTFKLKAELLGDPTELPNEPFSLEPVNPPEVH